MGISGKKWAKDNSKKKINLIGEIIRLYYYVGGFATGVVGMLLCKKFYNKNH